MTLVRRCARGQHIEGRSLDTFSNVLDVRIDSRCQPMPWDVAQGRSLGGSSRSRLRSTCIFFLSNALLFLLPSALIVFGVKSGWTATATGVSLIEPPSVHMPVHDTERFGRWGYM